MISRAISSTGRRFGINDFTMRVDDGAPIALPFRPLFIRAGRDAIVCVPGEDANESPWGGKTYTVNAVGQPTEIASWRARGLNPVAISDDDEHQWMTGQETSAEYFIRHASGLTGPFPAPNPDNHQGFATVEPLRMHTPFALTKVGDVTLRFPLKLWLDLGPWLFGEHKDVWYAYRKSDAAWFVVYDGPVTVPHTARLIDGQFIAAVNGAGGGFIRESELRRVEKSIEPTAIVPPFVTSSYAIGVGMFDDMVGPRLIDATEVPSANVRAVFHHVGRGDVKASMAVAKSLGWPCLFWWDGHGADPTDVPSGGRALIYGYPKLFRPLSETVAAFQADVARMKAAGIPCDVGIALYRQWKPSGYTLPEQQVLDCAAAIWSAAIAAKCGAAWIFSKHRGDVDGVDAFPSFQKAVSRMKGASPDWRTFPRFQADATPISSFFAKGQRFMGDAPMNIRGLTLTIGWDGNIHRPIVKFLRNEPGTDGAFADRDQPGAHEAMTLLRQPTGKAAVKFNASNRWLTVTPTRDLETRPPDHTPQIMEEFDDVELPAGGKRLIHSSGLVFTVEV